MHAPYALIEAGALRSRTFLGRDLSHAHAGRFPGTQASGRHWTQERPAGAPWALSPDSRPDRAGGSHVPHRRMQRAPVRPGPVPLLLPARARRTTRPLPGRSLRQTAALTRDVSRSLLPHVATRAREPMTCERSIFLTGCFPSPTPNFLKIVRGDSPPLVLGPATVGPGACGYIQRGFPF